MLILRQKNIIHSIRNISNITFTTLQRSARNTVDDGTVVEYLSNLGVKAIETENRQVERWKKSDKEYLSAVEIGDERKQIGLLNNMHYRSR